MLRSRALDKPTFRRVVGRVVPALGLALALVTGPVAVAESSERNGDITFMRQDDAGFWQTWVADADLGHQRQLTDEAANSGWPVWAPTGDRLAIDSDRADPDPGDDTGVNDVFVMNADGSGVRKVTDSVGVSGDPGWSPDGSLLAYEADRGDYPAKQGIYVSRPDGTHLRRVSVLPADAGFDAAARFSPDGRTLVFTRYRDDGQGGEESALFTIRLDGSREHQVTSFALHAGDATWSPDGRTLALEASPTPTSRGDVYTVRPDGSQLRNLTRNDPQVSGSADPVWSPDGRSLLFVSETWTTDGEVTGRLDHHEGERDGAEFRLRDSDVRASAGLAGDPKVKAGLAPASSSAAPPPPPGRKAGPSAPPAF